MNRNLFSFLLFIGLMFVGLSIFQGMEKIAVANAQVQIPKQQSIPAIMQVIRSTCESYYQKSEVEIRIAELLDYKISPAESAKRYAKASAYGIAYQNCVSRGGKN